MEVIEEIFCPECKSRKAYIKSVAAWTPFYNIFPQIHSIIFECLDCKAIYIASGWTVQTLAR
jgi:hypothetical protein